MQDKQQLLALLDVIMNPDRHDASEAEGDEALLQFCAGCPDPIGASWLIVECLDPMTDQELVERAMAMAPRNLADVPDSELAFGHPLRQLVRETEATAEAGNDNQGPNT